MRFLLFLILFLSLVSKSFAQEGKRINLLNADILEGDEKLGKNAARLIGNVQFSHSDAVMFCDSAYRFSEENRFEAFGNVKIVQKDSLTITGERLLYFGKNSLAIMQKNVVMDDGKMTLSSDELNYSMETDQATYSTGAVIKDGENILKSKRGTYFSEQKILFFKDSVELDNPRYQLTADSMQYSPPGKKVFFTGFTIIESKGNDSSWIYCRNGWYETETGKSWFGKDTYVVSKEQTLFADSLFYDSQLSVGTAFNNVRVKDHVNNAIVSGRKMDYDDGKCYSLITGDALLSQLISRDSLFLHSDTLYATWDSLHTVDRKWFAYHHCRIFKSDLQGKCDSLAYYSSDSTFRLYGLPVLWSDSNQLSADSVYILVNQGKIDRMLLFNSAFISSPVDSVRFDQIRGKDMTGYFQDSKLDYIQVEGNGQSVYHVKNSKGRITGVNRADCTDMTIRIENGKVSGIHLYVLPEGTLFPIADTNPNEFRLRGFSWQQERRPKNKADIFFWK